MKIDYEYIKEVLTVFLDCKEPALDCSMFTSIASSDWQKFAFHMIILDDKGLVVGAFENQKLGISIGDEDEYEFVQVPWRLTAAGHDFASTLNKPGVLEIVQKKFKDEGLSSVIDVAKKVAKKRVEKLLDEQFS